MRFRALQAVQLLQRDPADNSRLRTARDNLRPQLRQRPAANNSLTDISGLIFRITFAPASSPYTPSASLLSSVPSSSPYSKSTSRNGNPSHRTCIHSPCAPCTSSTFRATSLLASPDAIPPHDGCAVLPCRTSVDKSGTYSSFTPPNFLRVTESAKASSWNFLLDGAKLSKKAYTAMLRNCSAFPCLS